MGSNLRFNYFEIAAVIIFGIGFTMLFLNRNLVKKIIGFNFMDSGVFLFLASGGYIDGSARSSREAKRPRATISIRSRPAWC